MTKSRLTKKLSIDLIDGGLFDKSKYIVKSITKGFEKNFRKKRGI